MEQELIPNLFFEQTKDGKPNFKSLSIKAFIEYYKTNGANPYQYHRLNFYAILMCEVDEMTHFVDFTEFTLKKGDALIVRQRQIQSFSEKTIENGHIIIYPQKFGLTYLSKSSLSKISKLHGRHNTTPMYSCEKENRWLKKNLEEELAENDAMAVQADIIGSLLAAYLLRIGRYPHEKNNPIGSPNYYIYVNFLNLLESKYMISRNAAFFAQELNISYKHLNECCKEFTTKTAKSIIDEFLVLEIKRFLISTSLSNKEIAYKCGFEEPTNFLKFFKKHERISTKEFRLNYTVG